MTLEQLLAHTRDVATAASPSTQLALGIGNGGDKLIAWQDEMAGPKLAKSKLN